MNKLILTFLIMAFATKTYALETDNYLMWKRGLKDSSKAINAHILSEIKLALSKINSNEKSQGCLEATEAVAGRFMSYYIDKNPLENWVTANLSDDEIYPRNGGYVSESIYRNPFRFYLAKFPLAPNVMINGVYLGTDKLTHISSTGRRYFNHYLKELKKGATDREALMSAVRFGLKNEASILGYWSSGVLSYGDMEANFQGLLFYKKLCFDSTETYLVQDDDDKWHVGLTPDIRDYINPYLDETFNLSYRLPANWVKVAPIIKAEYCSLADSQRVVNRMAHYHTFSHRSFSLDYVRELQAQKYEDAPVPEDTQSFNDLCRR
jgi:hypothetical protein